MSKMCNKKCIITQTDNTLSVGEITCIDRCVGKYLMAQTKVGEVLKEMEAQMAATQQMQAKMGGTGPK